MNQTQRKFLLDSIEAQFKKERSLLNEEMPKEPSLNNYLTASILDGSFKMKDPAAVREAIRTRVIKLGKKEALLCDSGDTWGNRNRQDSESENFIKIPADVIFEMPEGYQAAITAYTEAYEKWSERSEALSASFEAMKIKVQLGSDKALSQLVDQADKLCSMSLTASSRLLIGDGK